MSRRLFSRLISCWTRNRRNPGTTPGLTWPELSIRLRPASSVPIPRLYSAEQLDELHDLISARDCADTSPAESSRWSGGLGARQAGSPHVVDRAIADLTNPRRRSKRPRW